MPSDCLEQLVVWGADRFTMTRVFHCPFMRQVSNFLLKIPDTTFKLTGE